MTISARRISIAGSRFWSVILARRNNFSNSAWRVFRLAEMVCGDCRGALSKMLFPMWWRRLGSRFLAAELRPGCVYHRLGIGTVSSYRMSRLSRLSPSSPVRHGSRFSSNSAPTSATHMTPVPPHERISPAITLGPCNLAFKGVIPANSHSASKKRTLTLPPRNRPKVVAME